MLDENNIRSANNLALIYIEIIKDIESAKIYLDHSIKVAPNDPEAYNLYGKISSIENDNQLAIRYYKKSILLDKNYFKNYYDIALVYLALNNKDIAKENLNISIKLCPDFKPAQELIKTI